jgi:hypothetical protein
VRGNPGWGASSNKLVGQVWLSAETRRINLVSAPLAHAILAQSAGKIGRPSPRQGGTYLLANRRYSAPGIWIEKECR